MDNKSFESSLPKAYRSSFPEIFNYIAGFASILSVVVAAIFIEDKSISLIFYLVYLFVISLVLVIHGVIVNSRKLHRYAQAVVFTHYVNHIIRDSLEEIPCVHINSTVDDMVKNTIQKIANAVSDCFSIVTARRCRVRIVEMRNDGSLNVIAMDEISGKLDSHREIINHKCDFNLRDNTEFLELWYGKCPRYFLSDDLVGLYKSHKYKSSLLDNLGPPDFYKISILGMQINYKYEWILPYRSLLVVPIRYIKEFNPPSKFLNSVEWHYYGFLCIDSNSKNCFEKRFSPELAGAFADAIYTYLNQVRVVKEWLSR